MASLSFKVRVQALLTYTLKACILYGITLATIEKLLIRTIFKNYHSRHQLSNRMFSVLNAFVQLYCYYKFTQSKRGYTPSNANLAFKHPSEYGHWKDIKEIHYASTIPAYLLIDIIHLILIKDPNLYVWLIHHSIGFATLLIGIVTDQFFCLNVIAARIDFISIPLFIAWGFNSYFPDHRKTIAVFRCIFALIYLQLRTKEFCIALAYGMYYSVQNQSKLGIKKRDQRSQIGRYCCVLCGGVLIGMHILWTWKTLLLAKKAIQRCI